MLATACRAAARLDRSSGLRQIHSNALKFVLERQFAAFKKAKMKNGRIFPKNPWKLERPPKAKQGKRSPIRRRSRNRGRAKGLGPRRLRRRASPHRPSRYLESGNYTQCRCSWRNLLFRTESASVRFAQIRRRGTRFGARRRPRSRFRSRFEWASASPAIARGAAAKSRAPLPG